MGCATQVLKDFVESHRRGKKGKTELRIRGLTGHEAADQVPSHAAQPCSITNHTLQIQNPLQQIGATGQKAPQGQALMLKASQTLSDMQEA